MHIRYLFVPELNPQDHAKQGNLGESNGRNCTRFFQSYKCKVKYYTWGYSKLNIEGEKETSRPVGKLNWTLA